MEIDGSRLLCVAGIWNFYEKSPQAKGVAMCLGQIAIPMEIQ